MASAARTGILEQLRAQPLQARWFAAVALASWIVGAVYCSGYERLLSGLDNWPGSLVWSAVAVLPWLALFEWSKSASGRRVLGSPVSIAAALAVTAALSLMLEAGSDAISDHQMASLGLSLLRRLPAIGTCLLLIFWSRAGSGQSKTDSAPEASLASLASAIDWIEAADNYIELHIVDRTVMRRMTMREAERTLAGRGFVRIHRRYLVNRRKIAAVAGANGDRVVRLTGGAELPVGRAFAVNLTHPA